MDAILDADGLTSADAHHEPEEEQHAAPSIIVPIGRDALHETRRTLLREAGFTLMLPGWCPDTCGPALPASWPGQKITPTLLPGHAREAYHLQRVPPHMVQGEKVTEGGWVIIGTGERVAVIDPEDARRCLLVASVDDEAAGPEAAATARRVTAWTLQCLDIQRHIRPQRQCKASGAGGASSGKAAMVGSHQSLAAGAGSSSPLVVGYSSVPKATDAEKARLLQEAEVVSAIEASAYVFFSFFSSSPSFSSPVFFSHFLCFFFCIGTPTASDRVL